MISSALDTSGEATRLTADAQVALNVGDTARAGVRFEEAGKLLERKADSTRKSADKHLLRFLAATQYYKGGHYAKAQKLCRHIQANLLPGEVRPLYTPFLADVRGRAVPEYAARVRTTLLRNWTGKDYGAVLDLFREHPYVLAPVEMAFIRAVCCERLKDYMAAAAFFARAIEGAQDLPGLVLGAAAFPLTLSGEGRPQEAWQYVECQLKAINHPIIFAVASLVRFHQASVAATQEERRRLSEEQAGLFGEAKARYETLPPDQQKDSDYKDLITLCFGAAAFGLLRLGQQERVREVCDAAVSFNPSSPGVWTVRGMIAYPGASAVEDCQEAVRRGESSYQPYYFLAHNALVNGQFAEVASWCAEALRRRPSPAIATQLAEWAGLARSLLNMPAGVRRPEESYLIQQAEEDYLGSRMRDYGVKAARLRPEQVLAA
jgi:tetratricopeptide (TPR) repeat protein